MLLISKKKKSFTKKPSEEFASAGSYFLKTLIYLKNMQKKL